MEPHFRIFTVKRLDDMSGRWILRFTPVLIPDVTARGDLTFAFWEVWEDEPDTHEEVKAKTLAKAKAALKRIADMV